jgi:Dolichyl-phosphate-mannose-protein mannosyltransferase
MLRSILMPGSRRAPRIDSLVAGLLIAGFLLESFLASRGKSATCDEPTDIAAALSYLETRHIRANPQHPPLVKELAGLSLWLAGVRLPDRPESRRMLAGEGGDALVGDAVFLDNDPARVLLWARLPMILLAGCLGLAIYLWGSQLAGHTAALAALFLCALDPTLVAHSFLATMDVGFAAFALLFFFTLWNYLRRPTRLRLVCCGLALGAMLAAKFSALFLLPVAAVLVWIAMARQPQPDTGQPRVTVPALVLLCVLALVFLQVLYFSPGGLYLYGQGVGRVNADHDPHHLAFMAGRMQHHFIGYFAVAYLIKEPIPNVLLAGIGLVVLLRRKTMSALAKLFILLPPVVLFVAHSLWADDLGIRYIIPALPFAWLTGGIGAAWLLERAPARPRPWGVPVAACLGLWLILMAVGIYPDHLAYFNEAACLPGNPGRIGIDGGARCGTLWLDDSNVDWGQGLIELKSWMVKNAGARTIRLGYFGGVSPQAYGLFVERIGVAELLLNPTPGLYVVSGHLVAQSAGLAGLYHSHAADWLREKPQAIIGHSLYVYERVGGQ